MKTNLATAVVESGGLAATGSFSIKATGKAFKILSDGLYSDKPRAVIRELSCNAWDSHVAAGRQNVPFEVHLPNVLEPWFSVRDFGVGLSDDQVMKLYTTYFESTKTDSNDFIGALGLGSKSPFSYVDSFTVTSRFNGTLRSYTAFLGPDGTPTIARMSEEPTTEPNGLEVSMPVEQKDFGVFRDRAADVLKRFKPLPVITGAQLELKPPTYVVEGTGWAVRTYEGYGYGSRAMAIQGNVTYPINAGAINEALDPDEREILNLETDLFFDIGELEVAASREALQYDKRTVANIKAKLQKVRAELPGLYAKHFAGCTTLWQAKLEYQKLAAGLGNNLTAVLSKVLVWNGHPLKDSYVQLRVHDIPGAMVAYLGFRELRRKNIGLSWSNSTAFTIDKDVQVYWDDTLPLKGISRRLKNDFLQKHPDTVIVIRAGDEATRDLVLDKMGNPPFTLIADLELPPPEPRAPRVRSNVKKVLQYDGSSFGEVQHDVTQGGHFVRLFKKDEQYNGKDIRRFNELVADAKTLGIHDGPVFGFQAGSKDIPDNNPGWIELYPLIEAEARKLIGTMVKDLARQQANLNQLQAMRGNNIVQFLEKVPGEIKRANSPMGKLARGIAKLKSIVIDEAKVSAASRLAARFNIMIKPRNPDVWLEKLIEEARTAYPLLADYLHPWDEDDRPRWVEYVNLLDAKRK